MKQKVVIVFGDPKTMTESYQHEEHGVSLVKLSDNDKFVTLNFGSLGMTKTYPTCSIIYISCEEEK